MFFFRCRYVIPKSILWALLSNAFILLSSFKIHVSHPYNNMDNTSYYSHVCTIVQIKLDGKSNILSAPYRILSDHR